MLPVNIAFLLLVKQQRLNSFSRLQWFYSPKLPVSIGSQSRRQQFSNISKCDFKKSKIKFSTKTMQHIGTKINRLLNPKEFDTYPNLVEICQGNYSYCPETKFGHTPATSHPAAHQLNSREQLRCNSAKISEFIFTYFLPKFVIKNYMQKYFWVLIFSTGFLGLRL